jgi:hypothetical protein
VFGPFQWPVQASCVVTAHAAALVVASTVQQAPVAGGGGTGHEVAEQAVFGPFQRPVQASCVVTAQEVVLAVASSVQHAPVGGGGGTQEEAVQLDPGPRKKPWAWKHARPVSTEHVGAAPAAPGMQHAPVLAGAWASALEAAPVQQTMLAAQSRKCFRRFETFMSRTP